VPQPELILRLQELKTKVKPTVISKAILVDLIAIFFTAQAISVKIIALAVWIVVFIVLFVLGVSIFCLF